MNDLVSASVLLRRIKDVTKEVSSATKRGADEYAASHGRALTCVRGCAACCYQKILVSIADGLAAYLYLRREGKWDEEMRQRLAQADAEMVDHDHYTWFERKKPCPFLQETSVGFGTCGIYPVRSVSCASTFSIAGDAALCFIPGGQGQFQAILNDGPIVDYMALSMYLEQISGFRQVFMTYPGAVLLAAALVERRPLPNVRRLPFSDKRDLTVRFDEVATHKGPSKLVEAALDKR